MRGNEFIKADDLRGGMVMRKIFKGLRNPSDILPYLLRKYHKDYWRALYQEDTLVAYDDGKYQSSPSTPPEYHAKLYYEIEGIRNLVEDYCSLPFNRSLELGCGFGRLSPWIANLSAEHHSIDPSIDGISEAYKHYPHLNFIRSAGQHLPYPDSSFEFAFTWNVLMHIPPQQIAAVASELERVLAESGTLLIMENTTNAESQASWGRSKEKYEEIFQREVAEIRPRPVEKTYNFEKQTTFEAADNHMMLFLM